MIRVTVMILEGLRGQLPYAEANRTKYVVVNASHAPVP